MLKAIDATHCHACGDLIPPRSSSRGSRRKYCDECAPNGKGLSYEAALRHGLRHHKPRPYKLKIVRWAPPARCSGCDEELPAGRRKWCSNRCDKKDYNARHRPFRLKIVHWTPPAPRHWIAGSCSECGEPFVSSSPTRCCSAVHSRRRKSRRAHERRRTKRIGGSQSIDLVTLAHRDGWRCHLCGGIVTRKTWSVDHLTPISRGGSDNYDNVMLAHHGCNSARGSIDLRLARIEFANPVPA